MRRVVSLLLLLAAPFVVPVTADVPADEQAQSTRPNIVLIFPDNLGWGEVGVFGGSTISTSSTRASSRARR